MTTKHIYTLAFGFLAPTITHPPRRKSGRKRKSNLEKQYEENPLLCPWDRVDLLGIPFLVCTSQFLNVLAPRVIANCVDPHKVANELTTCNMKMANAVLLHSHTLRYAQAVQFRLKDEDVNVMHPTQQFKFAQDNTRQEFSDMMIKVMNTIDRLQLIVLNVDEIITYVLHNDQQLHQQSTAVAAGDDDDENDDSNNTSKLPSTAIFRTIFVPRFNFLHTLHLDRPNFLAGNVSQEEDWKAMGDVFERSRALRNLVLSGYVHSDDADRCINQIVKRKLIGENLELLTMQCHSGDLLKPEHIDVIGNTCFSMQYLMIVATESMKTEDFHPLLSNLHHLKFLFIPNQKWSNRSLEVMCDNMPMMQDVYLHRDRCDEQMTFDNLDAAFAPLKQLQHLETLLIEAPREQQQQQQQPGAGDDRNHNFIRDTILNPKFFPKLKTLQLEYFGWNLSTSSLVHLPLLVDKIQNLLLWHSEIDDEGVKQYIFPFVKNSKCLIELALDYNKKICSAQETVHGLLKIVASPDCACRATFDAFSMAGCGFEGKEIDEGLIAAANANLVSGGRFTF